VTQLYLYDDAAAREFEPFALTRPVSEMRAGAEVIRRRWERALGMRATGFIGAPHLADFEELDAPPAASGVIPAGSIVASSRCVVAMERLPADAAALTCAGQVAALRLRRELDVSELVESGRPLDALASTGTPCTAVAGRWLDHVWDFVGQLSMQLADDVHALGYGGRATQIQQGQRGIAVHGPHPLWVEPGAVVEPYVFFDVAGGPIYVSEGAHVHAFTRVVGPCYLGPGSSVSADKIANCSIGEVSRVHGELSTTIVLGHSNKAHDGFVGHSYLGRWVNLGAGTTTSNLKNTYGTVALWTPKGVRDTGLQFLGTLFGDHAKTGIGMRLTTGSVIGAGANVYGSTMPPKYVEPFSWGDGAPYGAYRVDKFIEVAGRAMARRSINLGERGRRQLVAAFARGRSGAGSGA